MGGTGFVMGTTPDARGAEVERYKGVEGDEGVEGLGDWVLSNWMLPN